ncbi:cellulose synthase/poly-beta-1,6-N-acetylglucosamine synthase-like glycosyltransferase [Curtobacterium pusillum]|uniref:Cellulose synthase/poly-beta-1,6-N-acetylglucosamine synthase-like glycosyltransferase n=1 Tax=Curtobacterium pusillum TaxID=69373 RepID=A0AAW3T6S6_9MICO|nr:glycosyltransferase family 2 protein [Curtobacterium pusillum]MBA8990854.1 cellulose synthase/poly-beta-1,6-N-acetylglucosamine synthase-like glycosyltransferase [Curtobacterium pusillum]
MTLALLNALATAMAVAFIAYVAFILVPFLRHTPDPVADPEAFQFHFLVPCRDEDAVIGATIATARTRFPSAHLWVIDDASEDATRDIVLEAARIDPRIHLVARSLPDARRGKGDALNAAYRQLLESIGPGTDPDRVIVGVVDADGELDPDALPVVAGAFEDPRVGATQVTVWMKNRADPTPLPGRGRWRNRFGHWLVTMQDLEFRTVIAGMQSLRARTGTVGLGGNGQFARLSTLQRIAERNGTPWHGALLEDYELGLHVLLAGYRIRHVYDAHVSQEALPSLHRLITQRTRWAQGNIQCLRYTPRIIASPHFSTAGVLEAMYYLLLPYFQLIGIGAVVTLTVSSFLGPATEAPGPGQVAALFVFALLPFAVWGPVYRARCEPGRGGALSGVLLGIGLWAYVFYMYVCILRAFVRLALRRNGWSKTRRNAERVGRVRGSVAVER